MKKLLLSIFIVALYIGAFAQKTFTISGIVADSVANKTLDLVTVSFINEATKQPVKSLVTNENGSFKITASDTLSYQLTFTSIGYNTRIISIGKLSSDNNLGRILLSQANNSLKEVSISAVKPLVNREIDRIAYNVQNDPDVRSLSALDIMQKVPLLSVDANNAISLKGNKNFKILINNRESALMASRPSDVLKAMPAGSVEKIEVITTPPSKYDAEGLAGIINIILKKNATEGYNFSAGVNYNSIWGPEGTINAAAKYKKFGFSIRSGGGRQRDLVNTSGKEQQFIGTPENLVQNSAFNYGGLFHGSGVELTYEADSLNLLNVWGELSGNIYNQDFDQNATHFNSGNIANSYRLLSDGNWRYTPQGFGVIYQLNGAKNKDRVFNAAYKYVYLPYASFADNKFADLYNQPTVMPDYIQTNQSGSREHTVQADYVYPVKQLTLEAGGKVILRDNYSNYALAQKIGNDYINDDRQSNDFKYRQKILALYNTYQIKLKKWTAKAGVRLEHTDIDSYFVPATTTIKNTYLNLIPSLSVQHKLKDASFTLGYTQHIARPGIDQVNPFIDRHNPLFVSLGNPVLKPELNNLIELNYSNSANSPLNLGLSYTFSNDAIQKISYLDNAVTYSTYNNSASNKSLSLNANFTFNPNKDLAVIMNGLISRVSYSGSNNLQQLRNSGYTGNVSANFSYKMSKGYRMSADTSFGTGSINLQGQANSYLNSAIRVSKECFNKNGTITLVAANIFARYQYYRDTTGTNDYIQTTFNQNPYRAFVVRFNYKIDRLKGEIKKSRQSINNDDIKG
jgi:hypothetical protein